MPESMQFTAYITRNELEGATHGYDFPIARIAQIFASDIMPFHCKNYTERCANSGVEPDVATVVPRPSSLRNPLLPRAMSTSCQYRFHGYHPGLLESFLLHAPSATTSIPHLSSISFAQSGIPDPGLVDKSINRIHEAAQEKKVAASTAAAGPPFPSFTSTVIPNFPIPTIPEAGAVVPRNKGKGKMIQDNKQVGLLVKTDAEKGGQKRRIDIKEGQQTKVEDFMEQAPRRTTQKAPFPHLPASPTPRRSLYPKLTQSIHTKGSHVSVSTDSTFDWKDHDKSLFQDDNDPSSSTPIERLQYSLLSLTTSSVLTPIISMGPATEVALEQAGLADALHTDLRKLISTKRDTLWLSCLQGPPLSFSPAVATAVHAAILVDVQNSG